MKTLTLATMKGGSGKSSLAVSIAGAAKQAGESVVVLDLDAQGTAATWGRRREAEDIMVQAVQPADIRSALTALRKNGTTLAVVDTPGISSPGVAVAIQNSSFVLVPVRPSIVDIDAAGATVAQLRLLKAKFGLVLNAINSATPGRSIDAGEALVALGFLAPIAIGNRVDFLDATMNGQGVTELNPHGKAADEVRQLWTWCNSQMEAQA